MEKLNETKWNRIIGSIVFLIALVTYFITVAPTTSYWDCGEFIATSYTLSVPHPPGAPFFLLMGRIFSMIPFVSDIGLRVNTISVLSSAFTVLFLYLISVRLIKCWRPQIKDNYDAFIIWGSSAIGALTFAFTDTFWFNAVEAEVYAASMFFTSIIIWLVMLWIDKHEEPESSKFILLIMLLVGLGTGVHMLNILTLPTVVFIMWFYNKRMAIITGVGIIFSLMVIFAFPLQVKLISILVFVALTILFQRIKDQEDISLAFMMPLLVIIGYSTYIMVYIRAGQNPPINENDPSNWERMLAYLNREQYGDSNQMGEAVKFFFSGDINNRKYTESVAKLGSDPWGGPWIFFWKYQMVEMYFRYFNWQFIGKNIENIRTTVTFKGLYGIPFFAGLWGVMHHYFKDWKKALGFTALFLALGVGLIIYQNQDVLQPRERDYFYVGSFFVFAIWIGMGVSSILETLKDNLKLKKAIPVVLIFFFIIPIVEIKANFSIANRSGNYVAWDYSKNILETCDQNAILFTNGDNDTFPLWYLQEVEHVRTDVTIVNLSLLNTDWYIKQLKVKLPELIRYTDKEIEKNFNQKKMTAEAFWGRHWPKTQKLQIPTKDGKGIVEWEMKSTLNMTIQGEKQSFIKVQDQMVLEMIALNAKNNWKRPIYFAVTVASSNYIGIDKYLRMDGLCFGLVDYPADKSIDPEVLYNRLFVRYKDHFRNLDRKDVYYDDNKIRLLQNYRSAFMQLAMKYENEIPADFKEKSNIDPSIDYSFEDFKKLPGHDKIAYILQRMEQCVPSGSIKYNNEMIAAEIAGLLYQAGREEDGLKILESIDLKNASEKRKIGYLITVLMKGIDKQGLKILDELTAEYDAISDIKTKMKKYFELYTILFQYKEHEAAKILADKIKKELKDIENTIQQQNQYVEFSILLYQTLGSAAAIELIDSYLVKDPKALSALNIKFQIFSANKDFSKALETVNSVLAFSPDNEEFKQHKEILDKLIESENKVNKKLKKNN